MRGVDAFLLCKIRGVAVVSMMQNSSGQPVAYAAFWPLNFGAVFGKNAAEIADIVRCGMFTGRR
jgi:hypothetical protein